MAPSKVAAVFATSATAAAAMKCPGSSAWVHASNQVTATAQASCSAVAAEIQARASGSNGWVDPHNGGVYSVLSVSATEIETQRTTNPKTSVGGVVYTDKQIFTLTEQGEGECLIEACSESQGTSVGDMSTNYCDLRNLYCGSEDGCKSAAGKDFTVKETTIKPSIGASSNKDACIVKKQEQAPVFLETSASSMQCPGSGAMVHASAKVTAVADASCSDVLAEMKARVGGQNGWVDPHNGGIYSVLSSTDSQLNTQRTTNPKKSVGGKLYTDKQTFTLTEQGQKCRIDACSESQGFSVGDFSTNYCDMRNLYCGSADGCQTVTKDFSVEESKISKSVGASSDKNACIVKKAGSEITV